MTLRFVQPIRIGYMAGREIPVAEIAEQMNCAPSLIRNALQLAGITPCIDRGPVIVVSLPIANYLVSIDQVGRELKMSRDQVATAILATTFRGGPEAIEDVLIRGGYAGE